MNNPARHPQTDNLKKRKRNDTLKANLDRTIWILNVLGDVANLAPVAGFANAVPVIWRIVELFRVRIASSCSCFP